jgi:hypothetical protein
VTQWNNKHVLISLASFLLLSFGEKESEIKARGKIFLSFSLVKAFKEEFMRLFFFKNVQSVW